MWVPPETKDPVLLHYPTRKSVGYFGALRIRDGKFVYKREQTRFNADTFFSFLKYLRRISSHSGRKVILLVDNARYHHANMHKQWRDQCDGKFHIEFLPPYSPELNPIERVWKLTRRLAVHNRYFPSIDDVIDAVETIFDSWTSKNDILSKLCAII
jgi:transposase